MVCSKCIMYYANCQAQQKLIAMYSTECTSKVFYYHV